MIPSFIAFLMITSPLVAVEHTSLNGKKLSANVFGTQRVLFVFSQDGKTVTTTAPKRPHKTFDFTKNIGQIYIYEAIDKKGRTVYISFFVLPQNQVISTHGYDLIQLTEDVLIKKMQRNPKLEIEYSA